jgi:hypothetical protein
MLQAAALNWAATLRLSTLNSRRLLYGGVCDGALQQIIHEERSGEPRGSNVLQVSAALGRQLVYGCLVKQEAFLAFLFVRLHDGGIEVMVVKVVVGGREPPSQLAVRRVCCTQCWL